MAFEATQLLDNSRQRLLKAQRGAAGNAPALLLIMLGACACFGESSLPEAASNFIASEVALAEDSSLLGQIGSAHSTPTADSTMLHAARISIGFIMMLLGTALAFYKLHKRFSIEKLELEKSVEISRNDMIAKVAENLINSPSQKKSDEINKAVAEAINSSN